MSAPTRPVGLLLREWRERRRLSQLELSLQAEVSTRHLSFVETGRSRPTSEMILRLTEWLDVPLRERNALLLAGGYAPAYPQHDLDDAELAPVRAALRHLLAGHEPYPALVVDRRWHLLEANRAVALLTADVSADLLRPPVNVLRLALHPDGLAPRVLNLGTWRAHLLDRLDRQARATADPELTELLGELRAYPGGGEGAAPGRAAVVVPLRLRVGDEELDLLSTTTVFGTPRDVTLAELAIESFFPAGEQAGRALRRLVAAHKP